MSVEFPEGEIVFRDVPGLDKPVIFCRLEGALHAILNRCSHQEQTMTGGRRLGNEIRCPHHGVCHDLRTGQVTWDAGYYGLIPCDVYAVIENDGAVYVNPSPIADPAAEQPPPPRRPPDHGPWPALPTLC